MIQSLDFASLHAKLSTLDDVDVELALRGLIVHFKGNPLVVWSRDGESLSGDFSRENVVLCARSVQEAFDLTKNRIG